MTEPRRWIETGEVSPELSALFSAGEAELELPEAVRARVAMRVNCMVAASLTAGLAPGATTSAAATGAPLGKALGGVATAVDVSLKVLAVKAALGIGICASVAAAVVLHPPSSWTRAPKVPISANVAGATLPTPLGDNALPAATLVEQPSAAAAPSVNAGQVSVESSKPAESSNRRRARTKSDHLAHEIQELRRAKGLVISDPAQALRLIQAHAREFPAGRLQVERQVLELRALLAVGRRQLAEQIGAQLLVNDGARLYHGQVRRLLGINSSNATVK